MGKSSVCTVPVKCLKSDCNSELTGIFQNWIMKNSWNLNISCKFVFYLNRWKKKVGSPSLFRRKRPFISLNSWAFIENLSSSGRARARARANQAKNDAQKGCAMQLNGITLSSLAPHLLRTVLSLSPLKKSIKNVFTPQESSKNGSPLKS